MDIFQFFIEIIQSLRFPSFPFFTPYLIHSFYFFIHLFSIHHYSDTPFKITGKLLYQRYFFNNYAHCGIPVSSSHLWWFFLAVLSDIQKYLSTSRLCKSHVKSKCLYPPLTYAIFQAWWSPVIIMHGTPNSDKKQRNSFAIPSQTPFPYSIHKTSLEKSGYFSPFLSEYFILFESSDYSGRLAHALKRVQRMGIAV